MIMIRMIMMLPHHEIAGAGVEVRVVVPLLPGPHTGSQQLPGSLTQLRSAQAADMEAMFDDVWNREYSCVGSRHSKHHLPSLPNLLQGTGHSPPGPGSGLSPAPRGRCRCSEAGRAARHRSETWMQIKVETEQGMKKGSFKCPPPKLTLSPLTVQLSCAGGEEPRL